MALLFIGVAEAALSVYHQVNRQAARQPMSIATAVKIYLALPTESAGILPDPVSLTSIITIAPGNSIVSSGYCVL